MGNSPKQENYFSIRHLQSDLKNRAVKGVGLTVVSRTLAFSVQTIGTIVLARLLSPEDFGLVAMVTVFSMLVMDIGMLGLSEATIQQEEITHEQTSTLFWINIGVSLAMTLFFMAMSPMISWFFNDERLKAIAVTLALSFFLRGASTQHGALLRRGMHFSLLTVTEILASIVSTCVAISLAFFGWGYWSLVARRLILHLITTISLWKFCYWRPGPPVKNSGVTPMLKFGLNSLGSLLVQYFTKNLDKLLIGWRYDSSLLGFYDRAYYLFVMPLNQLTMPISSVAVVTLSRLSSRPDKFKRYYLKVISILAFIGMPLSAVLTLIGNDLILLILGEKWIESAKIFTAFGPGIGIMLIYYSFRWIHISIGRADRALRWSIITFIVTAISLCIGLFCFDPLGVAIAYVVSFYILICPGIWYAGKPINIGLRSFLAVIWKPYVCALFAGILCWSLLNSLVFINSIFVEQYGIVRIIVSISLFVPIYLLLIIVFYQSVDPIKDVIDFLSTMFPIGHWLKRIF